MKIASTAQFDRLAAAVATVDLTALAPFIDGATLWGLAEQRGLCPAHLTPACRTTCGLA